MEPLKIRAALAISTTLAVFGVIVLLVFWPVPVSNATAVNLCVGALISAWAQSVLGYYYASSPKEKSKDDTVTK